MFKQVLRRSTNTLRARAFASEASWNSGTPSVEEVCPEFFNFYLRKIHV